MDFKHVLKKLLTAFKEQDIRYALMGGMALGVWGVPRGTVDIDFLVHRDDIGKIDGIMKELGYECKHKSDNVSQYLSPLRIFGEVDFLHAFRTHSLSMLQRTVQKEMFAGAVSLQVLQIEDLIGFKLQGMVNDESRRTIDLPDIESLMAENRKVLDWDLIREYFELFDRVELFDELREKYGHA
ncbi:MAG: nucleotidyltransferase family protein [Nitrospirae bacterium]|nr:nucleotidyltransferase family protein [Nitrospirota bacterium]